MENRNSVILTKAQYDYLLPAMPNKLLCRRLKYFDEYYFIGTADEIFDMRRRLIGLSW
jgi:hypothetical protein